MSLGFLDRFLDEVIRLRDHDAHGVREQRADDAVVHEDGGLRRDAVRVQLSLDARQVVRLDRDEHEVEDAIAVRFVVADEGHARFRAHGVHERLERGDASGRGAPLQHHLARGARGLELARHVRPHAASPDHEHGRCGSHVVQGVAEAGTARRDARVTPAFGVTPPRLVRARRATGEFASPRSRPRAHPYDECGAERGGVSRNRKEKKSTRSVAPIRRPPSALENGGDFAKILLNARCAATSSMARGVSCTAYRLNTRPYRAFVVYRQRTSPRSLKSRASLGEAPFRLAL